MLKTKLLVLVGLSFVSCGPGEGSLTDDGSTEVVTGELQVAEVTALQLMREEEKLARDTYQALGARWGLSIFANIASSEQTHMDAVLSLLTRYRLNDPAAGRAAGEFTDPSLQALYHQLVARGSVSPTDALTVGALIEDLDLADLTRLSTETSRADILRVYANLMKGSRNHLRSFYGQLGGDYVPQYLDEATFTDIVSSTAERGPAP